MKRNKLFNNSSDDKLLEHKAELSSLSAQTKLMPSGYKQCIAFHEAGHAAGIYLNNKARNLPPVFFQIMFKDLNGESEEAIMVYQVEQNACIAKVKGGRSIKSLPSSIEALTDKTIDHNDAAMPLVKDYMTAFEVDIINLLIGPLAEAKYIAEVDGELFSQKLVDLGALKNYGGSSDLELAYEYLQCFSACKQQQGKKLAELFTAAFNFITDRANWAAITKLANYILNSDKNIISCEEVALLFEH